MDNTESEVRHTVFIRVCLLSVGIVLLFFSIAVAKLSTSPSIDSRDGVAIFSKTQGSAVDEIERSSKFKEVSKQLEFMVWKRERQALVSELTGLLHDEINIKPFDAALWRDLSFVYKHADVSQNDRAWVLQQAATLQKWNIPARTILAHHCVNEYAAFQQSAERLCDELIRALPLTTGVANLARKVGVSQITMQSVLEQEGLLNKVQP